MTRLLPLILVLLLTACGQRYWYCWDVGSPSPHHLGHRVAGDHLCSNAELGR